jgi:hypothetical protein
MQRRKDGPDGISEALVENIGPQGIDSTTVGAAKTTDPCRQKKAFEVSGNITMAPDTGRIAGQAAGELGPWIRLTQFY